ncbi:MAG: phosphodiester glycosidase family protein [Lachnospiraceae bacterium]|nr:phosphodiester glycosidase family protein [Lachnospiraceae bacterium]
MKRSKTIKKVSFIYTALLLAFSLYVVLDTFVIPRQLAAAEPQTVALSQTLREGDAVTEIQTVHASEAAEAADAQDAAQDTGVTLPQSSTLSLSGEVIGSWSGENASVTVTALRAYDTTIYFAEVAVTSPDVLKTAFAYDTYGKNVKQETSEIAEDHDAVLAINGDFYGSRNKGYVIRNGVLYRDKGAAGREDLAILSDGSFLFFDESEYSAQELLNAGALQVFSFGPALLSDGSILVDENDEVGKAMASNPRTAIGRIDDLHYMFVVSDGRSSESEGLSLYELATLLQSAGVRDAYNLDGGGSSTMVFLGEVINKPTTRGSRVSERDISDIVYIGE